MFACYLIKLRISKINSEIGENLLRQKKRTKINCRKLGRMRFLAKGKTTLKMIRSAGIHY